MPQIAEHENLTALIPALVAGRQQAFRDLVKATSRPLLRYALSLTRDEFSAQDVLQETYLRVYRARKGLGQVSELRGYLFRVTRNVARSEGRSAGRRKRHEQEAVEMQPRDDQSPELSTIAREAWERMEALPGELREVLELRFGHGLSREEVAAALDIPEGTVATRQRSGLEKLRAVLALSLPAPVLDLPDLIGKGAEIAIPSSQTHLLVHSVEELAMIAIRRIKLKSAGAVVSVVLVALLLVGAVGTTAAVKLSGPTPGVGDPVDLASASGANPDHKPRSQPTDGTSVASEDKANADLADRGDDNTDSGASADSTTEPTTKAGGETLEPVADDTPGPKPAPALTAPPKFLDLPARVAPIDIWYSYEVQVAGKPAPTLELTGQPHWLVMRAGCLEGTPSAADAGWTGWMTLHAHNGIEPSAELKFQLLVGSAPSITSSAPTKALVGVEYRYEVKLAGEPKPTLTAKGLPAWLSLSDNLLSGTPDGDGIAGPITLTATNGVEPAAKQVFAIVVEKADAEPGDKEDKGEDAAKKPPVKRGISEAPPGVKTEDDSTHDLDHVTRGQLKSWLKKGFKFEWEYSGTEHSFTPGTATRSLEILKVADDAIEIEIVTRKGKGKRSKEKKTCTLEELTICLSPAAIDPEACVDEYDQQLVLNGDRWLCRVYEFEPESPNDEEHAFVDYFHFSKKYPGLVVKWERLDSFEVYDKKTDDYTAHDDESVETWTLVKVTSPK